MASFIRPNRTEVNRTFPWLGFTIRTGTAPAWFEVAIATDPSLFDADAKSRRTMQSFYSTRAAGPLPAPSGEAVWIVPPAVLARFAGQPKIFYALATFKSADRQSPEIVRVPAAAAPAVALSRSFTGVTRRLAGVGGRSGDSGPDYGSASSPSLEWAGDTVLTTAIQPTAHAPAAAPPGAHASALDWAYSDGFGPLPPVPPVPQTHLHGTHRDRHRYPSQALGNAIDIYWGEVELVPQPNGWSCWAAAAAMVVGWRDRVSIDPSTFGSLPGYADAWQNGLNTDNNAAFAQAWGLDVVPPLDPSVDYFAQLLQNYGPLWIGRHPSLNPVNVGHAVAVIGLHGDGSPDGTFVHWHDPSPPGRGTANRMESYTRFLQEFDDFMTVDPQGHVNNQILHASGTGGRSPGHVPGAAGQSLAVVSPFGFDATPVTRQTETSGDITMNLESWDGMKYPPGAPTPAGVTTSAKRFTIEGPRYAAFGLDNIYANVDVDFQYDGRGVGKVALRMGEHSDAVSKGLTVTAHIADDARTFQGPSGQTFAGIRITIDYAMTQVVADDVQMQIDVMLYGSGDYDVRYHEVQGTFDHKPADVVSGVRPATAPARAQSRAQAIALGTFDSPPVTRATETSGDLTMNLESWDGMKYPPGAPAPAGVTTNAKRFTIEGPRYAAFGIDNIYANVDVDFQYDGRGVGKVALRMGEHSDAVTKGLTVTAHIVDDARTFQGPSGQTFAGIRITIDYTMSQVVADDVQSQIDVMLYGSGDYDVRYHTVQGSFDHTPTDVISGVRVATAPPRAQAVAMEGEGGGAAGIGGQAVGSIAGVVVQRIIENIGDLTVAHESWNGMRYPAGVARGNVQATPKNITIQGPHYKAFYVDDIYCDLSVDFEYDGRGVGKVAMRAAGRSDAVGKGLDIQAHIVDDARTFQGASGQTFAGIRITLEYSFTQTVADDIVVHGEAYLYGNGDYDVHYHLIQGEVDHMPAEVNSGVRPTTQPAVPQASALDAADVLKSIGGFIVDRFDPREDGIDATLDRWPRADQRGGATARKFPFDDPNEAGSGGTQRANVTVQSPHTSSSNYCDLAVSWDYNGRSLTNVDITTGDAHGVNFLERLDFKYTVTARIEDIAGAFADAANNPPCAGLRILIEWREHRPVKDNTLVLATLTIFGNGGYMLSYDYKSGDLENWTVIGSDHYHPSMRPVGRAPAQAHSLGAEDVLKSIGGFIVDRFDPSASGIDATLERWPRADQRGGATARKFPFDDPNEAGSGGTQRANITVTSPRSTSGNYCDLAVSWDYNGRSLTNVDITTGDASGVNFLERLDFKYTVTARIEDIAGAFQDAQNPPCGGLRILLEWREHRPVKDNTLVLGTLTIFGNGGYMLSYDYKSGDVDNLAFIMSDHFHPSMRAVGRAPAQAHGLEAAPALVPTSAAVTRSSEQRGSVRFDLDQLAGVRQPPGHANGAGPMQTATVAVVGPRAATMPGYDETYGDCEVSFEYDGHSVANVHVRPTAAGGTAPLQVLESLNGDPQTYVMPGGTDPFVAVPLDFSYSFTSAPPAATSLVLYGNGTHDIHYRWSRG